MAPIPSENGVEGDDEREEEEEEEDEEEEEEPRLKYQRMGGSIPSLIPNDAASCIAIAERMIALGTHAGTVHILDFLGNQVSGYFQICFKFCLCSLIASEFDSSSFVMFLFYSSSLEI